MAAPEDLAHILDHRRQWRECLYVYPVVSRRSKGLSIGVNLNPDKTCNYSCLYCQIDRRKKRRAFAIDLSVLHDELHLALEEGLTGQIWNEARFANTPKDFRRVSDIAFSGDGEPTCVPVFDQAVATAAGALADVGKHLGGDDVNRVKLIVITNGSALQSEPVARALPILDAAGGELWIKLDAGTEGFFQCVNRPAGTLRLQDVLDNILAVSRDRAVVIQSLFFRLAGNPPAPDEITAYCRRLTELRSAGAKIKLVQVHTIARPPAESCAAALDDAELDALAAIVRKNAPEIPVDVFYGADVPPQHQEPT